MSFSENLKMIRKERNMTQEQLAELLNVSRQAVSKWESGNSYPETEKLLVISNELNISIDELLADHRNIEEENGKEQKTVVYAATGKITIPTFDNKNIVVCQAIKTSKIFAPKQGEPKYILLGVDRVTFLGGEHTTILGWYETLDDICTEIKGISEAISKGKSQYSLKYAADIKFVGVFGQPKIKR